MYSFNAQKLMTLVKNNEQAKNFNLDRWASKCLYTHELDDEIEYTKYDCNTHGCLVGNDVISRKKPYEQLEQFELRVLAGSIGYVGCSEEYGITPDEAQWLFSPCENDRRRFGLEMEFLHKRAVTQAQKISWEKGKEKEKAYSESLGPRQRHDWTREPHEKEAAINRVRKFIYYKLHKNEMMTGGTPLYDQACKTGHANITSEVLQQAQRPSPHGRRRRLLKTERKTDVSILST